MKESIKNWFYTFPIQLIVLHLKSNLVLLFVWLITLALALGLAGGKMGFTYLLLTPEYFGEVGFWSFFWIGLTFGAFLVTWNITTYILHSPLFPFLASLRRPFTKFFLNNGLIPAVFLLIFLWRIIDYQWYYECWSVGTIFNNISGFISGLLFTLIITIFYFTFTNKDIYNFVMPDDKKPPNLDKPVLPGNKTMTVDNIINTKTNIRSYLTETFKWRPVRSVAHYEEKYILDVFKQNHVNAIVIQTVGIMVLITTGYLIENPYFRIPAGASFFIFLSVATSIAGVMSYWLHKWTNFITITLLIIINSITKQGWVEHKNLAFGLVYDQEKTEYSFKHMQKLHSAENIQKDKEITLSILKKWKKNLPKSQLKKKPKLVMIGTSGGGLRAALWTMQVLQQTNKETNGKLMDHTVLMTGASGGIIAHTYFRELLLQKKQGKNIDLYHQKYLENMGKDLLNPIVFTVISNDIFMPWNKFEEDGQKYPKDRGYIFEAELNKITDNAFSKRLKDYKEPELNAEIPMLFISPAVVNDGRRLIMSPLGVSYMATPPQGEKYYEIGNDAIDFGKLFEKQKAENLRVSTAVRANASFPYILPNVALPSEPRIELADAGFMDNMGLHNSYRFAHVFKDWIKENTSGIVFVVVRGSDPQDKPISERQGLVESAINPIRIMRRIVDIQDFEQDTYLAYTMELFGEDFIDFIPFTYQESKNTQRASMSFHLTKREKIDVINSFYQEHNQESLKRLKEVLR